MFAPLATCLRSVTSLGWVHNTVFLLLKGKIKGGIKADLPRLSLPHTDVCFSSHKFVMVPAPKLE